MDKTELLNKILLFQMVILMWCFMFLSCMFQGFRTGYVYREPIIRQTRKDRANSDVEVPPSSSSFAYSYEDDLAKFM